MKGPGVELHLDADSIIRDVTGGFDKTNKLLKKASNRAVRKTMRWIGSQILKILSADLRLPREALKARVFQKIDPETGSGVVWLGLNPVPAHKAGAPHAWGGGVVAGHFLYQRAFVVRLGGSDKIFRRVGKNRLPIEMMTVNIKEPGARVMVQLNNQAAVRFKTILEQELNYAVNHEKS